MESGGKEREVKEKSKFQDIFSRLNSDMVSIRLGTRPGDPYTLIGDDSSAQGCIIIKKFDIKYAKVFFFFGYEKGYSRFNLYINQD